MSSTVGASGVEKQEHSCLIQKIECKYELRDKKIECVLYSGNKHTSIFDSSNVNSGKSKDGKLFASVSNNYVKYYLISNNQGKDIEILCNRNANICDDDSHKQVEICAPDMSTNGRALKTETHSITEKKFKVYYYDLFHHAKEWSINAARFLEDKDSSIAKRTIVASVGYSSGWIAGNGVDFFAIFRYLHLPLLKSAEEQFVYDLQYFDCYCNPNILFEVYPDVEFSVKICCEGYRNELRAENETQTISSREFSFEFAVKYGNVTKQLDYNTFEQLDKQVQNNALYKSLKFIGKFFNATANLADSLTRLIDDTNGNLDTPISKDVERVADSYRAVGGTFLRVDNWLSGSLYIEPSISAKWYYDTSANLQYLLRHIELSLRATCKGELKIDLIAIFWQNLKKLRTISTGAALVAAFASGGLATILVAFIKFLIDVVTTWLINKLKEGFKFNLILVAKTDLEALTFDSLRDTKFSGLNVKISPEIRLEFGVDAKASISMFLITVSGEAGASIDASSSLEWTMSLDSNETDLGIEHDLFINPFKIMVGVYVTASFEISKAKKTNISKTMSIGDNIGYKSGYESKWSNEWSVDKIECEIDRWVLFKYEPVKNADTNANRFIIG